MSVLINPPAKSPWYLRPALWLAGRIAGKDPLPARVLSHYPKGAIASGLFEAMAAHGPSDLETRTLKLARVAASVATGCPFCIDMNAANHEGAKVALAEVRALLAGQELPQASAREGAAVRFARALSETPVVVDDDLAGALRSNFTEREIVVLATTIAQVNYWARLNQGLGIPSAGFFGGECAIGGLGPTGTNQGT